MYINISNIVYRICICNCDLLPLSISIWGTRYMYHQRTTNTASVTENDSDESSESSVHVIYYGDLNVNIGQPFEITCIIPITAKVHWMKNGESITRHNLRHGRDDHSYTLSETAFEGEYDV